MLPTTNFQEEIIKHQFMCLSNTKSPNSIHNPMKPFIIKNKTKKKMSER